MYKPLTEYKKNEIWLIKNVTCKLFKKSLIDMYEQDLDLITYKS